MVIILELDDDPLESHPHERASFGRGLHQNDVAKWGVDIDTIHQRHLNARNDKEGGTRMNERLLSEREEEERHNPNINEFTQALTCYPFV